MSGTARRRSVALIGGGLLASAAILVGSAASAQQALNIMSNSQGSVNYNQSVAVGAVLKQKGNIDTLVTAYAGPQVWLHYINEGTGQLGMPNALDVLQAMRGTPPNYRQPNTNLRLVSVTFAILNGVVTRQDSGVTRLEEARGRRVSGEYVAHQTCLEIATGQLATVGLTWKDVRVVPVQSSAAGGEALRAGRVEVNMCAPIGQAVLQQAHVQSPLRFISIGHDAEAQKRMREHFPIGRPALVKKDSSFGVLEDTWVWQYDFYLVSSTHVKDDAIYEVTKTLWNSIPDLVKASPGFRTMTQERMADRDAEFTIPYHEGAIRFYKEQNVWTPEMEKRQQALLKEIKG